MRGATQLRVSNVYRHLFNEFGVIDYETIDGVHFLNSGLFLVYVATYIR